MSERTGGVEAVMAPEFRRRAEELARECAEVRPRGGDHLAAELRERERTLREAVGGGAPSSIAKTAWLLDNYSFVRSQIRELRESLPRGYYRNLPRLADGSPRIRRVVAEWLALAGERLNFDALAEFLHLFQHTTRLRLSELWAVSGVLRLELLARLSEAAQDPLATDAEVGRAIGALRLAELTSWKDFVESVAPVHAILCNDPAGVYARMEFETRDAYRHSIEAVAHGSRLDEAQVARAAVELAREGAESGDSRRMHVGYYLAGPGLKALRRRAARRNTLGGALHDLARRYPNTLYLGAAGLLTAAVTALAWRLMAPAPAWVAALLALPASQVAITILNLAVNTLLPPRRLPRMDFSEGIPDGCRAFVVVPTLLLSRRGIERLLERLEIHYLANRDPNLFFALLTDFPDSPRPHGPQDRLLEVCAEGIGQLNRRYAGGGAGPFYLFHRERKWNEREGAWMGWERKRGKLLEFNRLLLGEADGFATKIGDCSVLPSIRYVITLDSDTQLPRDTARKLVATMAHPLNRPVIDPATNTVRDGYAVMQPRVSVSVESAGRSRLARIYSGQTGFDPYTTAVSDVYQDLHARASFTGKGIYDVRAFEAAAGRRFPQVTLLSHDLIEGEHARTALVTDLEVIDDYPTTYEAYSKRKHRWVRGDWQIARWVTPRVPAPEGSAPNPLPAVARWKIADNLRRSLFEISLLLLLLAGWFALPGTPFAWTALALAFLFAPAYIEFGSALLHIPPRRFWRSWSREVVFRLVQGHVDALVNIVFLGHQALLMADAIGRTLVRMFITHRRLLEWESMAQAEEAGAKRMGLVDRYLVAVALAGVPLALLLPVHRFHDLLGACAIVSWMAAPAIAKWLNAAPAARKELSPDDSAFLRDTGLRTWRYFRDLCGPEHHWLTPDNVQEDPPRVAHRASPTNLGLLLSSNFAAHDFGYLTSEEVAARLDRTFETMARMERCRGHFYNWYDTATLEPQPPLFVSTVDSGNLAASLIEVKQGCLELLYRPVLGPQLLAGLQDYVRRLRNALPAGARTSTIVRLLVSLERLLEQRPTGLFYWESLLTEAREITLRLREPIEWIGARLAPGARAELDYWYGELVARSQTSVAGLCAFAPWLAPPFEAEFRWHASDARLAGLVAKLDLVLPLGKLADHHAAIARDVRALAASPEPLRPALRSALGQLAEALPDSAERAAALARSLRRSAATAGRLVAEVDFAFLFDRKRKLLRIGYDAASGALEDSCYDLLASEARTAVLLAIAKGDIPREAWFHLGRKLTSCEGRRTLVAWTGTLFEYLMPALHLRTHEHTVLGESVTAAVRIQQRWARGRGIPWGISESAYAARDSALNYQYRAFGIPEISVKHGFNDELVVAPYASALALMVDPPAAVANLAEMEARGWTGTYGFYEACDFTPGRAALVRAFMAHHQAMTLLAIANTLLDAPVRRRFHSDPLVLATEYLLQERVPLLPAPEPEELPLPVREAGDRVRRRPALGAATAA